jgi:hypothetical protein
MPVNVTGIKEMKKALGEVDKDLLKGVQAEIRAAMLPIRDKARGYAPADSDVLSGWTKSAGIVGPMKYRTFPKYNQQQVVDGIKYSAGRNKRNQKGWAAANYVSNNSAPGQIFETAGRKSGPGGAPWIGRDVSETDKTISHSNNPRAGAQFIAALDAKNPLVNARPQGMVGNNRGYKQKGRLIYRAAAEEQGKAMSHILKALDDTAAKFVKRTEIRKAVNG